MPIDQLSLQRIQKLHPKLRAEATQILEEIAQKVAGRAMCRITYTLRTFAEQTAIYNQGRTTPGKKVTNAKAGQSIHNYGLAVDFAFVIDGKTASWDTKKDWDGDKQSDWMEVVAVFKKYGWEWGGDWRTFKDMPHFQKTFGYSWQRLLDLHTAGKVDKEGYVLILIIRMIHRHELDFEILNTGNPKTIVFMDSSAYYEAPDRPLLQVIPPGYTKYFTVNIMHGKLNTLNSNLLGISQSIKRSEIISLPDGVWTFTYRVCPYDKLYKQKYHLRTVALKRKLGKVREFIKTSDCSDCSEVKKEIVDILVLIWSGESAAEESLVSDASDFYQKALTKVNRLVDKVFKTTD